MSSKKFKTEVNQLLHLIIHSLYSHPEIFLRELISNSSDAIDKLKYLTLTDDAYKSLSFSPRIDIIIDEKGEVLTLSDNGVGMNSDDLSESLGTIARSGTKNFLEKLTGDEKRDSNLIGQFGVGFYSSFMVADKVEVISQKAGEEKAYKWESDGKSNYSIDESKRDGFGTTVVLHLNEAGKELASRWQLTEIVKKYSNHIAFPIHMSSYDESKKEVKEEQVNAASALWKRSKTEIKDDEYIEFYKTLSHSPEDPLFWTHTQAEGTIEYTTLFYIPQKQPFDIYQANYQPGVKLYVKRVFITDDDKELLPPYLRFVKGVIDTEDLPLNVSREILQKNRVLSSIKRSSVKKILDELKRLSQRDSEKFSAFTGEFNKLMKEGLYTDFENKETLLELIRFKSTKADGWVSLKEYLDKMDSEQKSIFYISGGPEEQLRKSPLLEFYKKREVEVLIMDEEMDELIIPVIGEYQGKSLKGINRSGSDEELKSEENSEADKNLKPLLDTMSKALGEQVKEVKTSVRLANSPSCIIFDEGDPSLYMQQFMKALGQGETAPVKPILEINPDHAIIKQLEKREEEEVADVAQLLLDQALMIEGVPIKDTTQFTERLNRVMEKALSNS